MIDLVVRKSAFHDKFYIDYHGAYKIEEVSKSLGIKVETLTDMYKSFDGEYDDERDVYYFSSAAQVKDVIEHIVKRLKPSQVEMSVKLTLEEIEFIRKALINEDSNVIFTGNKLRESIFKKLNS